MTKKTDWADDVVNSKEGLIRMILSKGPVSVHGIEDPALDEIAELMKDGLTQFPNFLADLIAEAKQRGLTFTTDLSNKMYDELKKVRLPHQLH
jgi:hypothetical protein